MQFADDERHADERHEQLRQPNAQHDIHPSQQQRNADRAQSYPECRAIREIDVGDGQVKPLEKVIFAGSHRRQPQQVLELIHHQQQGGAQGEAHDHGMRNIARQIAQAQQRNAGLHHAHQQGQHDHGRNAFRFAKAYNGTEDGDRNGVGGPIDQLLRRIEQGADGRHHNRSVQAVLRRDIGDLGVGHRLGHGDGGHGEAGHGVGHERAIRVGAQRIKRRHQAKQRAAPRGQSIRRAIFSWQSLAH